MPSAQTAEMEEVVCPACGHRFHLAERLVDHLQKAWERAARQRLKTQLRQEMAGDLERQAKRMAEETLRHKDEELRDRDREVARLRRQITTLSKKVRPDRAQALGDVRAGSLAEELAARFPADEVQPVARGVRGADVVQLVRSPRTGQPCGTILWESKRAATWSKRWLDKLRQDQRRGNHAVAVIVSDARPNGEHPLAEIDGIWVAAFEVAADLAAVLRDRLIQVARAREVKTRREDLKGRTYDYLTGPEFPQHIVAIVETAQKMRTGLDEEQRALQARWAERERQIESVVLELAEVYGDLRGIGAALPAISVLELAPVDEPLALPAASEGD